MKPNFPRQTVPTNVPAAIVIGARDRGIFKTDSILKVADKPANKVFQLNIRTNGKHHTPLAIAFRKLWAENYRSV